MTCTVTVRDLRPRIPEGANRCALCIKILLRLYIPTLLADDAVPVTTRNGEHRREISFMVEAGRCAVHVHRGHDVAVEPNVMAPYSRSKVYNIDYWFY